MAGTMPLRAPEITALPTLRQRLPQAGSIIPLDRGSTEWVGHPKRKLRKQSGCKAPTTFWPVKGNQSSRQTAVPDPFNRARAVAAIPRGPTVDGDHGRTERWLCHARRLEDVREGHAQCCNMR